MSKDAPERIWAFDYHGLYQRWTDSFHDSIGDAVEYIRADIYQSELREMALQLLSDDGQMADKIDDLVKENERLRQDVNRARYGEPDFAWSIHQECMSDLTKENERLRTEVAEYKNILSRD